MSRCTCSECEKWPISGTPGPFHPTNLAKTWKKYKLLPICKKIKSWIEFKKVVKKYRNISFQNL